MEELDMEKKEQLYEGKAKKVFATDDPNLVIVDYKDDATAFNGLKKGSIAGKGVINNVMSNHMFQLLEKQGVPTHFVEQLSERETLVKKVSIVPLEVIIRNISAGSFAKRFGVEEGICFETPVEETYYKSDELDDPFINESQSLALKIVKKEELDAMWDISRRVNEILTALFDRMGLILVDFKLEFGRLSNGRIVLADEFSPDNCRLWDKQTRAHMDKDVYRRDLGDLTSVYEEVLRRLKNELSKEEA